MAAGTAAVSGEITSDGTGMGKSMSTPHQVSENHMLMQLHTAYSEFSFDAANHPMTGMSGPCFGAVEVNAGAVSGGGKCLYTDADGDLVTMDWMAGGMNADGAMTGTWTVSGGTGKWTEATGEGTFASLTDPATGESTNSVSGTVMMP
ncbi:hypothetical protein EJA01_17070 [Rhodovulum iodosum]|nr:hypothetical protein [Rhodovulum robiginosum]RSK30488.1 hypothetical protein EJA01_17070 [Rhodovulum robiginosum]